LGRVGYCRRKGLQAWYFGPNTEYSPHIPGWDQKPDKSGESGLWKTVEEETGELTMCVHLERELIE